MFGVLALPWKTARGKKSKQGGSVSGLSRQNESGSVLLREDRRKFLPVTESG